MKAPSVPFLDIERYNALELRGRVGLSVRALQVGAPVTFDFVGYPHRVFQEAELATYVDVFGGGIKGEILREFYKDPYPLTHDEIELVRTISDAVTEMTQQRWGRPIRPWVGPLSYMGIFRMLTYISGTLGRRLTIFETGPGAGYLGCLAALAGHRYIATDIAQNQYLWQNRLYTKIAGDGFQELADADPAKPLEIDPRAKIVHIPWWIYAAFYKFPTPFRSDVFVSEKNLGEMGEQALDYTFAFARETLAGPAGLVGTRRGEGLFLFSHVGFKHASQPFQIMTSAATMGFLPLIYDDDRVLLVHKDVDHLAKHCLVKPRGVDSYEVVATPSEKHPLQLFDPKKNFYDPSGRGGALRAIDHLPLKWSEAPTGYEWLRYLDRISDIRIED
jgi:hypothetical protein